MLLYIAPGEPGVRRFGFEGRSFSGRIRIRGGNRFFGGWCYGTCVDAVSEYGFSARTRNEFGGEFGSGVGLVEDWVDLDELEAE